MGLDVPATRPAQGLRLGPRQVRRTRAEVPGDQEGDRAKAQVGEHPVREDPLPGTAVVEGDQDRPCGQGYAAGGRPDDVADGHRAEAGRREHLHLGGEVRGGHRVVVGPPVGAAEAVCGDVVIAEDQQVVRGSLTQCPRARTHPARPLRLTRQRGGDLVADRGRPACAEESWRQRRSEPGCDLPSCSCAASQHGDDGRCRSEGKEPPTAHPRWCWVGHPACCLSSM